MLTQFFFTRWSEVRLTDLGNDIHELFIDVLEGCSITVVVDVHLDQRLWVLAQTDEDAEDEGFLADRRVSHLEYRDEDFVQ